MSNKAVAKPTDYSSMFSGKLLLKDPYLEGSVSLGMRSPLGEDCPIISRQKGASLLVQRTQGLHLITLLGDGQHKLTITAGTEVSLTADDTRLLFDALCKLSDAIVAHSTAIRDRKI